MKTSAHAHRYAQSQALPAVKAGVMAWIYCTEESSDAHTELKHLCLWTHNYLPPVGMMASRWHCIASQMCRTKLRETANTIRLSLFDGSVWYELVFLPVFAGIVWVHKQTPVIHTGRGLSGLKQQRLLKVLIHFWFQVAPIVFMVLPWQCEGWIWT